jgi:hypothetical protein
MKKQSTFSVLVLVVILLTVGQLFSQNVSITNDGSPADASAMLDVKSTSKGFLAPRMTVIQRENISAPATGLLVYQTDEATGYYYFNGVEWIQFSANQFSTGQLSQGKIFIGDGSGSAAEQTLFGDVTLSEIGETAIGYSKVTNDMLSGSISADKLAGGIYNYQLAGSITNDKLAGSITSDKLAGGITNAQLDGSISNDKLASGSYMITSAGSNGQVWTSDGNGAGVWAAPSRASGDAVPDLVEAIKEQQKQIEELKKELDNLKKKF